MVQTDIYFLHSYYGTINARTGTAFISNVGRFNGIATFYALHYFMLDIENQPKYTLYEWQ